jgi:hypothetical protein
LLAKFLYNTIDDTYESTRRNVKTTGRWHKKTGHRAKWIPNTNTPTCKACPVKHLCTSRTGGREIDRSEYAAAVEENNKRYRENPQLYRTGD